MNNLGVKEKIALFRFKESLKCKKINKISVLAKESTAFIDYMQYCKEILGISLTDKGASLFDTSNKELREKFDLCQKGSVEEECEQLFEHELKLWNRLLEYLKSQQYEYISDYSYVTDIADKQVSSNCLIFKKDGKFVLAKIKAGKTKLSYKARKFENKLENDFDLLTMVREAQQIFEDKEVECSLFYLKGKDDTSDSLEEYELKKGHNIITLISTEFREVTWEYLTKTSEEYEELSNTGKKCENCKFEFFCDLKNHKLSEINVIQEKPIEKSIEQNVGAGEVILSEAQEAIVSKGLGNFLVSAVPGAGKTRILIERVKRLISKKVSPKKIMLITFTNEAMKEIKKRLVDVNGGEMVYVTTFNKFGQSILSEHYSELGYELPPVIVTKYDSYLFLIDVIKELGIKTNLKYVFSEFGMLKKLYSAVVGDLQVDENSRLPEEILSNFDSIKALFYKKLLENSLITYDMQITEAIKLLQNNTMLKLAYESEFEYIMVDEYQDSDDKNAELVNLISNNNVMVVGDEDQSIYGFKGANLDNFLKFEGEKYFMTENYRSSDSVVNVSNALISKNLQRLDSRKRIIPKLNVQGQVRFIPGERSIDKLPYIVKDLKEEGYQLDDIAVIARTHTLLDGANEALKMKGINTVYGAENLINTFEFKMLYHFLNAYVNDDSESLMIVSSYLKDLDENVDADISYHDMFAELSKGIKTEVFSEVIDNIASVLGNKEHIMYAKFKESCSLYGIYSLESLHKYMYGLMITEDVINIPVVNNNGVALLTAHAAKGSEYRAVIVLRTDKFKAKTDKELEEERRLLYVTLTRAKEKLFITYEKEEGFINELGIQDGVSEI
ncbi:MAG: ATP-dependent helicase [Candidatus Pacebacteria bacterium]|nr:ATP-dependent helicase [Candidatus Paceibacterota bacterium]